MEQFFQSVQREFLVNRSNSDLAGEVLGALLALALLGGLAVWLRALWLRRSQLSDRARELGLGPADVRLLRALATGTGVDPLLLLSHLQEFEAATAAALAASQSEGGSRSFGEVGQLAARLRRLRVACSFDRLSGHVPLLSSRELPAGTAVEIGPCAAVVTDCDELQLRVLLRGPPPEPGGPVVLSLLHAREARYLLHCPLRALRVEGPERTLLTLGHDEAPQRQQAREFARVGARGSVELRWGLSFVRAGGGRETGGELVDLSGGGLQLSSTQPLPVGLLVTTAFDVGGERFAQVPAVVIGCERAAGGQYRLRLEFRDPPESERERLISLLQRIDGLVRPAAALRAR
jgi:hypothetical protein